MLLYLLNKHEFAENGIPDCLPNYFTAFLELLLVRQVLVILVHQLYHLIFRLLFHALLNQDQLPDVVLALLDSLGVLKLCFDVHF